ncbi:MAG TPA: N-formylglutamate amidohydrolase [Magnetospirillaceae bacterium]|jgi:N-formylglutamate amidohydrolase
MNTVAQTGTLGSETLESASIEVISQAESISPVSPTSVSVANVLEIEQPRHQRLAMVFASPHSGRVYPQDFVAASVLDPMALRKSEDAFVDQLFASAAALGAPLLKALFPRALLDPNREAWEMDPAMFDGPLPDYVNSTSPRVAAGLGTIAKVVASGVEIYRQKLPFAEARRRVERLYEPYHAALANLVIRTRDKFGYCILVDCHSMPSMGGPADTDGGTPRVDFVLGDCFGNSCAPAVTAAVERTLENLGYRTVRNLPYSGGHTTRHYGKPTDGIHAVQIEINRRIYMDESTHKKRSGFARLQTHLGEVVAALALLSPDSLRPGSMR